MSRSLLLSAAGDGALAAGIPRLDTAWWGAWIAVGLLFAAQLNLHYGIPPLLALYWGLSDWSLWGLLGVGVIALTRRLRERGWPANRRRTTIAALAPVIIGAHVGLTILVGAVVSSLGPQSVAAAFVALFAKKLTLNALAFLAIAVIADRMTAPATVSAPMDASSAPQRPPVLRGHRARGSRLLSPSEILSACAAGNYIDLATDDGTWMMRGSLRQLEDQLGAENFVRVSRSALVNLSHVAGTRFEGSRLLLVLRDGRAVPVAKRRRADVQRVLRDRFGG